MATRNIVPRSDGEGSLGRSDKHFDSAYINTVNAESMVQLTENGNVAAASDIVTHFDGKVGANPSNRNRIINGDMLNNVYNGTTAATVTAAAAKSYNIDRWYSYCEGADVTVQKVASGVNGHLYKLQHTGAASNTSILVGQRIAASKSCDLAGNTVTLQAQIANSLLTSVTWTAYYATTEDSFGTIASPTRTQIATGTFTVSSTETVYSASFAVPSAAVTGIEIVFSVADQISGTFDITGVQLELGSTATPYEFIDEDATKGKCEFYAKPYYAYKDGYTYTSLDQYVVICLGRMRSSDITLTTTFAYSNTSSGNVGVKDSTNNYICLAFGAASLAEGAFIMIAYGVASCEL